MNIGELLKKIAEGKRKKIFTDETEVVLGIPSEIYRSTNGSDKGKLIPGCLTSLPVEGICISDTKDFPEEDEIPSTLELILACEKALDFYQTNCLYDEGDL